jgi:hypothetical protein
VRQTCATGVVRSSDFQDAYSNAETCDTVTIA